MVTIIALVLNVLVSLISPANSSDAVVVIPPMPVSVPINNEECLCDDCCWDAAYEAYYEEFTALFNSYSYKLSKNGRSMINGKFVKMGV